MTAATETVYTVKLWKGRSSAYSQRIARAITTARSVAGMTRHAFAEAVRKKIQRYPGDGVIGEWFADWDEMVAAAESGRYCPSADVLVAAAEVSGIRIGTLMGDEPLEIAMMEMRLQHLAALVEPIIS